MNEHLPAIVAGAIAALGGVGGLLIFLVRSSSAGERAARAESLQVLKDAAKENAAEASRNRDAAAAANQRTVDALASITSAVGSLQATIAALTVALQYRGGSGRSGQTAAVRRDDDVR